jgi:hypothetical protein
MTAKRLDPHDGWTPEVQAEEQPQPPTRDTPEAALAAVLRAVTSKPPYEEWDWDCDYLAAAILAALDGWTLVPQQEVDDYHASAYTNEAKAGANALRAEAAEAEIARLRSALVEFLPGHYPNNGDPRVPHLRWTIPEEAFGKLRAALAPAPSEHRVIPAMKNGLLRHPPTCVNCGQPIECPDAEWQHVDPSEP